MQCSFLFVGLDANYDGNVENSPSFADICKYHEDGVAFWKGNGVHHPFLLRSYSGDGRRYHQNFARIGFGPEHAGLVSFIELLHVPTVGRSHLTPGDLDAAHLEYLSAAIMSGRAEHIFISAGVARLMQASKVFQWLGPAQKDSSGLRIFYKNKTRTVYLHLHFSNYGKFSAQMTEEARAIKELLEHHGDA